MRESLSPRRLMARPRKTPRAQAGSNKPELKLQRDVLRLENSPELARAIGLEQNRERCQPSLPDPIPSTGPLVKAANAPTDPSTANGTQASMYSQAECQPAP